ncbi:peptide ABC transporter ATP-binding protein [Aliidiomarina minuta]|uniref:Peptide ABC transporter ATP-binding protein n=1 Tax=Aliidiomarina minuta TaxID=880057 RepID=A0A432WBC2_9GAMM|nr:ABC transporter ATP-binding protein [Aliidiomarina minuta]RUO26888.1 peptide ABC transporter ATP-binding protein [Aliidiomarina minuta]
MDSLIKLNNIGRTFGQGAGKLDALSDISLEVADGESLAIEGTSGSGKSTLLSIIGLLDQETSGEYFLRAHQVTGLTAKQKSVLRNRHIGWIFQNFNLINDMTAIENVALPLRYDSSVPSAEYVERAANALERVGLSAKMKSRPNELSGGQQQRVAIARALVNKPSLLLADEPTGNLDSKTSGSIVDLLLELQSEGTTVILVTHDAAVAGRCQRKIRLEDGRLVDGN